MQLAVLVLPILLSAVPKPSPDGDGGWIDAARYGFRIEGVRTCAAGQPPASGKVLVGAEVRLRTKESDLFVTARDFSLTRGGVILAAHHVDLPLRPRCLPLLQASRLRARQSARGFVLFEVPVAWTTAREPLVLAYQPTRWGGAQRIESRIAPCLDACADTLSTSRASNGSLATIPRR